MRWLINYFRQCFCKHEWGFDKTVKTWADGDDPNRALPIRLKRVMICSKCGFKVIVKY